MRGWQVTRAVRGDGEQLTFLGVLARPALEDGTAVAMQGSRAVDPSAVQRYVVHHSAQQLGAPQAVWEHPLWAGAEVATITHWEWPDPNGPENGPQGLHRPQTRVKVLYDSDYLALLWCVDDAYVRAQYTAFQDGTCRDSCCEFFVAPHADSHDRTPFFNFETNAGGTMLLYNCTRTDAQGNVPLSEEDGAAIVMKASLRPDPGTDAPWGAGRRIEPELTGPTTWCIEYHVRSPARAASLPLRLPLSLPVLLSLLLSLSLPLPHRSLPLPLPLPLPLSLSLYCTHIPGSRYRGISSQNTSGLRHLQAPGLSGAATSTSARIRRRTRTGVHGLPSAPEGLTFIGQAIFSR